ncbi:MAG TPA: CHAD domain-containing protein [Xanthobacteraceae bacterium]|nr:CHAD domain-containing protein [Xanthobacteraceae bacterium]
MGQEVELKLEVPPRAIARLKRLRTLHRQGRPQEKDLVSVYFDTAEHTLRRHGMSLRVRHIGDKRVQTVKANGQNAAGLYSRNEWEKRIHSDTPDLRAASRTALAGLMSRKLAHALKPVFETQVHRTVVPLNGGASRIELTLDRGEVRLGRKSAPISEVELELKRGRPADLFAVARKLAAAVPTRFELRSKADRGYALVGGESSLAVRAQTITLDRDMSSGAAFRAIALGCLHHLAANEAAVRGHDSEGVHQMRVGLRRLRAAIAVFSDLLDDDETARIKAELKWLTAELGPARDLDVYVTGNIKPLRRTLPGKRHIESLQGDLETSRKGAFARAAKAVVSARYRALVLDTLAWIESGEWTTSDDELIKAQRRRKALAFAREELARRLKKVSKRAKRLAELDARQRHKLRIGIKKLRYAGDFFAGLFSGRKAQKRLRRFLRGLKGLQDRLGALNDIAVHERLAGRYVGTRRRRQRAFAIGLVSGREQTRVGPLRAAAASAAERFADLRPFWA